MDQKMQEFWHWLDGSSINSWHGGILSFVKGVKDALKARALMIRQMSRGGTVEGELNYIDV